MKSISLLFLFFGLYITVCQAQTDSAYIKSYPQKWAVKGFLLRNFIQIQDKEKEYKPNNPANIGIGVSLRNTVIFMGFYGLNSTKKKEFGETKSMDFQLHTYGTRMMFDVFFQQYKGLYSAGQNETELYPDLSVRRYGAEGNYLFNGRKFSAKAAFEQSERQLKSTGSWIAGGGIYLNQLESDRKLFVNGENAMNHLQFGISGGYAYSLVINPYWLLSGTLTAGVHLGNELDELKKGRMKLYPANLFRMALSYNREDWSLSLSLLNNSVYSSFSGKHSINITSGNLQMIYVRRFDKYPFEK